MKLKNTLITLILTILIFGLLGNINFSIGENTENVQNLIFQYNDIDYNINVSELAIQKNININDYPYYAVKKNNSDIEIYYSKSRMEITYAYNPRLFIKIFRWIF